MANVLITGGVGFIGSHIARRLVEAKHNVILYDIVGESNLIKDIKDRVVVVQGDIADQGLLIETMRRYNVDSVVHLAAILPAVAENNPTLGFRVNFEGT